MKRRNLRVEAFMTNRHRRLLLVGTALACAVAGAIVFVYGNQLIVYGATRPGPAVVASAPGGESSDPDAPEKTRAGSANVPTLARVGEPIDGITQDELTFARFLVGNDTFYQGTTDVDGHPGAQLVASSVGTQSVEQRRLVLLYFDYTQNAALSFTVNLTRETVESATVETSLKPTPSAHEVETAFQIILDHPLGVALKDQYQKLAGSPLERADQTINVGRTYPGGPADTGTESCATDRCVIVLAQVPGSTFLTSERYIVNLSTREVLTLK